jgi:hypothetical protein
MTAQDGCEIIFCSQPNIAPSQIEEKKKITN